MTAQAPKFRQEGTDIVIPKGMTIPAAMLFLSDEHERTNAGGTEIEIRHELSVYPLEGAYALAKVIEKRYGFLNLQSALFQPPPTMLGVELDGKQFQIPWGSLHIRALDGYLTPNFQVKSDLSVNFVLSGKIRRKHEDTVKEIVEEIYAYIKADSLLQGKAIKVKFPENRFSVDVGYLPKSMPLSDVKREELIFPKETEDLIRTSLFVPIQHTQLCRDNKVPLKRGILLEGPYGVGKTLTADVTAQLCVENGWTFMYIENAKDLDRAIALARRYQPCVIFAEDIDSAVDDDERTDEINSILNTIDGIGSKSTEIMVVLTTNHVDAISQAMLRPGRLDAVIPVRAPDAEAAIRLIKLYARDMLADGEDLTKVGAALAGQIPAIIREAIERSKLSAFGNMEEGAPLKITADDLLVAAKGMKAQIELLAEKKDDDMSLHEKGFERLGNKIIEAVQILVSGKNRIGGNGLGADNTTSAHAALPAVES